MQLTFGVLSKKYRFSKKTILRYCKEGLLVNKVNKRGFYTVDEESLTDLIEGDHYVSCPNCGYKGIDINHMHYKVCCFNGVYPKSLYSKLSHKLRKKTDEQKKRQSQVLKDRFKTEKGAVTRKQITEKSREINKDPDFLKRKSKISKEVQNRPEQKDIRSKKSIEMWSSEEFRKRHKIYVDENIESLQASAKRARTYLKKTSLLHLGYKKTMLERNLKGFITEYETGPYSIDEADPLAKIAIEVDGCYWHGCTKCGCEGDPRIKRIERRKEGYLKKYGWLIVHIAEHEIKKDKTVCIEMIRTLQERRRDYRKNCLKEAFFKGELEIKSMDDTGGVFWKPLQDVCRHKTPHKKMLKVITETGDVEVTEDHSLFSWIDKKPVTTNNLLVGDQIVCCVSDIIAPAVINRIESIPSQEYTYDVSVPGTENAFLKSGILVHNSYSISGVSLDVEKSSKYESMKNNFIQEYDKAKEGAKRSIKIVKGLKQPRYGIGISSALGPYSKPGVQSRRNFISGFRGGWT